MESFSAPIENRDLSSNVLAFFFQLGEPQARRNHLHLCLKGLNLCSLLVRLSSSASPLVFQASQLLLERPRLCCQSYFVPALSSLRFVRDGACESAQGVARTGYCSPWVVYDGRGQPLHRILKIVKVRVFAQECARPSLTDVSKTVGKVSLQCRKACQILGRSSRPLFENLFFESGIP